MSMSKGFQRAVFSESTAAQFEVAEAVPGKRIRVRGGFLTAAAAQDADFESGSTSLGVARLSASFSLVLEPTDGGKGEAWLETAVGEALNITLGLAVATDGVIFWDVE